MYMPVLQKKAGELRALNYIDENFDELLPLVIINSATEKEINSIIKKYNGNLLIDTRKLDSSEISELQGILSSNSKYSNIQICYPISVLLNDDIIYNDIQYVIINKSDFSKSSFTIKLKSILNKIPNNIILDVGFINSKYTSKEPIVENILNNLVNTSRSIYIISGSVPPNLHKKIYEDFVQYRYELDFFNDIKVEYKNSNFNLIYGDYTICPCEPNDFKEKHITPVVQLKYTTHDKYIFSRNGFRRGKYNFSEACNKIVCLPEFNKDHCWADKYIYDLVKSSDDNRGNPTIWVSLGIHHHIITCMLEQNKKIS